MWKVYEKTTVFLLGNKHKASSTLIPGEGISEEKWTLW